MSYFGNLARALFGLPADDSWMTALAVPPSDRTEGQWDELLIGLNSHGPTRYGLNTITELRQAFKLCSPLPAIISQKAYAFVKGTVTVWNPATGKPVRGQFKEWDRLFQQPNPLQTRRQFFIQAYSYLQQFGYCVIDPSYPDGYNDRPYSLRVLPNWLIGWEFRNGGYNERPLAAYFTAAGVREQLDVKRLIIIRDSVCTDFDESTWLPLSRAAVLDAEVSNTIAALQARGEMITDRGANGLVANGAKDSAGVAPMRESEKIKLQAAWNRRNGGIMRGQHKIVFTDANLAYTPMTFNTDELGLHPENIANIKAICNRYGFPFTMLAEGYEGKYNNSGNARRDFQDTTVDPESMDFFEQLSRGLGMYSQNCEAYMDYSGVASVQMSARDRGLGLQAMNTGLETAWNNGIITRNQWLEAIGEDEVARPEFEKYKWELTPEELGAVTNNVNSNGQEAQTATQAN
jgi:hypothetical protein